MQDVWLRGVGVRFVRLPRQSAGGKEAPLFRTPADRGFSGGGASLVQCLDTLEACRNPMSTKHRAVS